MWGTNEENTWLLFEGAARMHFTRRRDPFYVIPFTLRRSLDSFAMHMIHLIVFSSRKKIHCSQKSRELHTATRVTHSAIIYFQNLSKALSSSSTVINSSSSNHDNRIFMCSSGGAFLMVCRRRENLSNVYNTDLMHSLILSCAIKTQNFVYLRKCWL